MAFEHGETEHLTSTITGRTYGGSGIWDDLARPRVGSNPHKLGAVPDLAQEPGSTGTMILLARALQRPRVVSHEQSVTCIRGKDLLRCHRAGAPRAPPAKSCSSADHVGSTGGIIKTSLAAEPGTPGDRFAPNPCADRSSTRIKCCIMFLFDRPSAALAWDDETASTQAASGVGTGNALVGRTGSPTRSSSTPRRALLGSRVAADRMLCGLPGVGAMPSD